MVGCEAVARKWGNSLGIVLPKDLVEELHIKENEPLQFLVRKKITTGERLFGIMKGKIKASGQEIKDMLRKELHHA